MTKDSDFKQLVREHMRATGLNYTAARAALRPDLHTTPERPVGTPEQPRDEAWTLAEAEHERILGRFVQDGRLVSFPARRKARAHVLLHLVRLFSPREIWTETEVNERLLTVVDDQAFWRRELVEQGYLLREAGRYWLTTEVPERTGNLAQEVPNWEALWLPVHLRS